MNKCQMKIMYKKLPNKVVVKGDLYSFENYDILTSRIYEKSNSTCFKEIKATKNDKYILQIKDDNNYPLKQIWNEETFNYFLSQLKKNPTDKIYFEIIKVNEYPVWEPPKYETILKESLKSNWESIKNEIKEELSEKYLNDGKRVYMKEKKENNLDFTEGLIKEFHVNVICNNCLNSILNGVRYICSECDNYNICEYCRKNANLVHNSEHVFIKLNNPVLVDIQKYNSIFAPNKKLLKLKKDSFEIDITIINNGEEKLKGCFISPIRFGNNYLGCFKKTIIDECNKADKITLNVTMKFEDNEIDEEDEEDNELDFYEGYFRLMTRQGIPFGDILYIKVIIEE